MRLRNIWIVRPGRGTGGSLVACGGGEEDVEHLGEPSSPAEPRPVRKWTRRRPASIKGTVAFEGTAPKNEPIKMNADPVCVKANATPQTQETYMVGSDGKALANVFVYVKDGLGNYVVRHADRIGQDRSAELPLSPARVRRPRRPAARNRQQRPDAAQHPRAAEGQCGVQHRPADPGHEDDAHLHREGSHGALQVRRARLDERLRRRPRSSVLRGHRRETASSSSRRCPPGTYTIEAWHEKLGAQTQSVTHRREGNEGDQLHVQGRRRRRRRTRPQPGRGRGGARPCPAASVRAPALNMLHRFATTRCRVHGSPGAGRQPRHEHRLGAVRSRTGRPATAGTCSRSRHPSGSAASSTSTAIG